MKNICFYISDYGYGHASRDIAIIRQILNAFTDVKIFVKSDGPFNFLRHSLPQESAQVIQTRNDVGVVFKENSLSVDRVETEKMLKEWLNSWDEYIHNEKTFCENHNVDVILSDIVPQPFIVADELNIAAIAISNFTWYYIFYNLFGEVAATERIREAYKCADVALVLPFNEEMNIFEKKKAINLVSREITMNRYDMRKKCGVSDDELLVYGGFGHASGGIRSDRRRG